jgi:hypothetical protein
VAHLGSMTTDKRLAFDKYVVSNKRLKEIEFEIEKNLSAVLFKKVGSSLIPDEALKSGTKFKIIEPKLYIIDEQKYAHIQYKSKKGFVLINKIRKPTAGNGTQYEDEVVDAVNEYIKDSGGVINIKIKGDTTIYKDIRYAIKVDTKLKNQAGSKGDPKADIILCSDIKNPLIRTSIYVSHKKEGGPEAFQQYGGLSKLAGEKIYNHPLVQKFLMSVGQYIENDKLTNPILMTFDDRELANMSIYGPDYGVNKNVFTLNHTQIIGQGKPVFKSYNDDQYIELSFSSHMSLSGDLSHFDGGYKPVFGATFRAGRGFEYNGVRYNGARVGIYPQKLIATRSNIITLK